MGDGLVEILDRSSFVCVSGSELLMELGEVILRRRSSLLTSS